MATAQRIVEDLFSRAGVRVDGPAPWDVRVHDGRFFGRVLRHKNLGLGESYAEGWWDCPRVDELVSRLLAARLDETVRDSPRLTLAALPGLLLNLQTRNGARVVARRHYDLGNDLFLGFLDENVQYSCAYFTNGDGPDALNEAQRRKLELICDKLGLGPGHALLDIGCGWGGLARHAARTRGCAVTAVNISDEQTRFARDFCAGLPVTVLRQDYREVAGRFDRVVSVGMFEHVGRKNHRAYMAAVRRRLKDGGLFLLHTIGQNESRSSCDPWIARHVFPRGRLPSIAQIARAAEGLFVMEDWHNLGPHYDRTLMAWHANYQKAWGGLKDRYGPHFKRLWDYYLLSCAGAFRARSIQLWQVVFSTPGSAQPCCRF
ncbi:MAG: cyclopropane fatty acyl phospholipid synthase [Thermodesulfobacteriota bacterium]